MTLEGLRNKRTTSANLRFGGEIAIGDLVSKHIAIGNLKSAGGTIAIGDLWENCVKLGRIHRRCVFCATRRPRIVACTHHHDVNRVSVRAGLRQCTFWSRQWNVWTNLGNIRY